MIGKKISHYRILNKLGEGGMGVVYEAEDTNLGRVVALKFLASRAVGDDEERTRFVREAKTVAALNHPRICTIHEIDEFEGRAFIAMERVEGAPLKDTTASGPVALPDAINLAIQVAEGLHEAHQRDVIHRDIKPANIMVTPGGQAKIMDFGLAKSVDATELTKTGTTLGTVAYMSPEQARGEEVDGRTDIWSLGAVLYELVTGQKPFVGDYEPAVVYSILNESPKPVTGIRTGVPVDLERIIARCMEKDREERYQTAADLIADLRRVLRRLAESDEPAPVTAPTGIADRRRPVWPLAFGAIVLAVAVFLLARHFIAQGGDVVEARKMLVVLPFENLGRQEDGYFAAGMTEEITSRLASVGRLGVISRKSAVHYANTDKTIRQIGEELDVEYAVSGAVRWARSQDGPDRVRITPQLIRVSDDTHLWSDTYDRVIEDIFTVQTDIAQKVVEELGITLLDTERTVVESRPTDNLDAYHAYLRGRYYAHRPHFSLEAWQKAIENYQLAVEMDPGFALAHAELSRGHSKLFYYRHDLSEERRKTARAELEMAAALAPDAAEVHLAAGDYYFQVEKNVDLALESYELAVAEHAETAEISHSKAEMYRYLGRWQDALEHYRRSCELSPRNTDHFVELAITHWWLRHYPKALALADESIALAPEDIWTHLTKAFIYWSWGGSLTDARSALEKAPTGSSWVTWARYWQCMYEKRYENALESLSSSSADWISLKTWARPKSMLASYAYELLGDDDAALRGYEEALAALESKVEQVPNDPRYHSSLGIVCAVMGQEGRAIREGKRAVELYPTSMDAAYGPVYAIDLAHIYAISGEHETALDELDNLLSTPGYMSVGYIEVDPRWNSLRGLPGYSRLLNKHKKTPAS
jgi:non-specific serine/threonine protein kinase